MLAVGADELGGKVGDIARCPCCKKMHEVKYGNEILKDGTERPSKMLAFVKCSNGKSYLVGIDGKELKA